MQASPYYSRRADAQAVEMPRGVLKGPLPKLLKGERGALKRPMPSVLKSKGGP